MPKAYGPGSGREKHNDWLPGFRWIPRRWTFYPFPVPAYLWKGNHQAEYIELQPGYPTMPGLSLHIGYYDQYGSFIYSADGKPHFYGYSPVPKAGQWAILQAYMPGIGRVLPVYFAVSWIIPRWLPFIGNKRFHFNGGLKPDFTLGDFGYWFPEASMTITKPVS